MTGNISTAILEQDLARMPQLKGSLLEGRGLRSRVYTGITWLLAILAALPLVSVLYMLIAKGGARINWETLTALPPAAFEFGGGIGPGAPEEKRPNLESMIKKAARTAGSEAVYTPAINKATLDAIN